MKLFTFIKANMGKSLAIAAIGGALSLSFGQTLRRLPLINKLPSK